MSFERLRYDTCSYEQRLKEATSPGLYILNTPANDCTQPVPMDPYIRFQQYGPATCAPGVAIDDHSELLGITRRASECPSQKHLRQETLPVGRCPAPVQLKDNRPVTEPTRLSNPPCTLRGTGINRWQWLPENPQEHALQRFQWNTDYRQVAKDNHRPCLSAPMDQTALFPSAAAAPHIPACDGKFICAQPPPAAHPLAQAPGSGMTPSWRSCDAIRAM